MSSILDNQGRWYELLSPTQVLAGQQKTAENVNISLDSDYVTEDEEEVTLNTEEIPLKYHLQPLQEQVLSQKLSQLSTTSHQANEHLNVIKDDMNQNVPYYLSKESKSFQQVLSHVTSNDTIEELRQMALLMHEISMIKLEKSLWTTYLKAGTGQLDANQMHNDDKINPQIWPIEVQQTIRKQSTKNIDNATCLTYVTQHLCELDNKMKQFQTKLDVKKSQFSEYLQTIQTFVQQGLESVRLQTEHQLSLVQYNYNDRALELKYLAHNPTSHQKQVVKKLTHAKYQEEITKEEYNLLKQRISIHKSSQTPVELVQEKLFNTIEDESIRRKLHQEYMKITQQAKEEMLQLYISTAQAQMDRYRKQFNSKLKQFWLEQHSLPKDQKLTAAMINLIEQLWKNMSESVKCVYKYKLNLLHLNLVKQ